MEWRKASWDTCIVSPIKGQRDGLTHVPSHSKDLRQHFEVDIAVGFEVWYNLQKQSQKEEGERDAAVQASEVGCPVDMGAFSNP
jgi:hypothetical protein